MAPCDEGPEAGMCSAHTRFWRTVLSVHGKMGRFPPQEQEQHPQEGRRRGSFEFGTPEKTSWGGWVVLKISRQEKDREEQSQGKNLRKAGVSGLRGLGSEKAVGDRKRRMRTCSEGLGLHSAARGLQLRVFEKVGGGGSCV